MSEIINYIVELWEIIKASWMTLTTLLKLGNKALNTISIITDTKDILRFLIVILPSSILAVVTFLYNKYKGYK